MFGQFILIGYNMVVLFSSLLLTINRISTTVLNNIKLKFFKKEYKIRENIYLNIYCVLLGVLSVKVAISYLVILLHHCDYTPE